MLAAPKIRKQSSNSMIHLEPAEVLSLLKAAKAKGNREWAMIVVAYKHGRERPRYAIFGWTIST
jgi:hypothetical protein